MFVLQVTPEMTERLKQVTKDALKLLEGRTNTPEEAFIVLDAVKRTLELKHAMFIVAPIPHNSGGTA